MLRTIACIMLATTALMAWEILPPVPDPATVERGSGLTYGNDSIWGIFPNSAEDETYFGYNRPSTGDWVIQEDPIYDYWLAYSACTFQWLEDGVFFAIGYYDGESHLLRYSLHESELGDEEEITEFTLGDGACIAYQPNVSYNSQLYPVPGWLYCLPGGGSSEFWRYAIPTSLPDQTAYGIFPGNTAIIADKTPNFNWPGNQSYYQLQVSTASTFVTTVIDVTVNPSEYQTTTALANITYFWRTRDLWGSGAWSTVHYFQLQAGWQQRANFTGEAYDGAAIAYEKDYYGGAQKILAFPGGGEDDYYLYNIGANTWAPGHTTDHAQYVGTSLVTHEATGSEGYTPWAVFGDGASEWPAYDEVDDDWTDLSDRPDAELPTVLGPGASLAYGLDDGVHYLYLTVGEDESGPRSDFYRLQLEWDREGQEAARHQVSVANVRAISCLDGVSVEYQLREPSRVHAAVYNSVGRQVTSLDGGDQAPGVHRLTWTNDATGSKLGSGTYFVLLDIGNEQATLKAVVR